MLRGFFSYLDDWLITAPTEQKLEQVRVILHTCLRLGFLINRKKSGLQPLKKLLFIGAVLDSTCAKAFFPPDRGLQIQALICRLIQCRF